jgi:hypothetical protein
MRKWIKSIFSNKETFEGKILVIGDSHSRAFTNNDNFIPFFLGAGKEHNLLTKENKNRVFIKCKNTLKAIDVANVLLVFSEPDCRYMLGRGWTPWENDEVIENIDIEKQIKLSTTNYFSLYQELKSIYPEKNIFILNATPCYRDDQNKITTRLNNEMAKKFKTFPNVFISINDLISEKDGKPRKEYYSDPVHLNHQLQLPVEDYFRSLGIIEKSRFSKELIWDNDAMRKKFKYNKKFDCYTYAE